jgi:hypothetical protein
MNPSSRTDKINTIAIGAAMRCEKIDSALSVAIAIREQRQQKQEAHSATKRTALLRRLVGKLLAKERGLVELRKMVEDASCKKGDHKLEAVILMKEDECYKARKIIAEVRNKKKSVVRQVSATCA